MIKRIGAPIPFVSRELFGGKGMNLLELGEEFPIPEGFVLSSEVYVDFMMKNNLVNVIREIIEKNNDNLGNTEREIKVEFEKADFPKTVEDVVEKELERIQRISPDPIAIRSSGIDEDGSKSSFAGQHDSFFGKFDTSEVLDYLKKCYASAFNAVALKYRQDHNLDLPKGMAVVVQNMKDFRAGFVVYSAAPFDYEHVLIEAAPGHCKSVVDGRPVDSYKVSSLQQINSKINSRKDKMWVFDSSTGRLKIVDTPKEIRNKSCLSDKEVLEITDIALEIEQCYAIGYPNVRKPQDIEGGYDISGKLWITQSRDITGMSFKAPDIVLPDLKTTLGFSYNVGHGGIYDGPVVLVEEVDPNGTDFRLKKNEDITRLDQKFSSGYVLVTPETNPTLDYHLNNCRAIVATECGIMSHAGATARERGLIFVGCVESNDKRKLQDRLNHGDVVCVGANKEKGVIGYR
ncbi:MAG: PEP/pyruvate-binding domain-containing protein [Candidatus Woesearchaeota archaeon]